MYLSCDRIHAHLYALPLAIDSLKMPGYIKDAVSANGIEQKEYSDLSEVLASTDVLYGTYVRIL